MTPVTWNDLGPREKQLLAILRRADQPLASRDVLGRLRDDGEEVAYTTVSTILDRLVEKGLLARSEETRGGSIRFRYAFDPAELRVALVDCIVEDVASVLDGPGLSLLVRRARTSRDDSTVDADERDGRQDNA